MEKKIRTQIGLALVLGLFWFISTGSLNWLKTTLGICGVSGYLPCPSPFSGYIPPPCNCWRGVCYSFSASFDIPRIGASPSGYSPSGYYVPGLGIIDVPWVASGLAFRCVEMFGDGRCNCPTGEWYLTGYYLSGVGPMSRTKTYYFTPSGIVVGTGISNLRYFYIPGIGAFSDYTFPFVWGTGYYDRGPGLFVPGRGYWIPSLGIIPEIGQPLVGSGRWRPGREYVPVGGIYQERVDLTGYYFKYLDKLYPRQEEFCVYKNLVGLKIDLDDDRLNDCIEDLCPDFSNPNNEDRDADLLADVCDVTTKKFLPNELTTDFFERRGWDMPNEIKIGLPGKASIEFKEKISDAMGLNLDDALNIEHNLVSLDPTKAPQLNKPARITLYNLPFKEPKILKDGEKCPSTICTMISYSGGTLIFDVTSFSSYSAAEGKVETETPPVGPAPCGDWPPTGAPVLFLIETTQKTATLYFTPVRDHLSYYYIAYGYSEGDQRFGVEFPASLSTGVESYTVKALAPNTTYYFRVRGGNGCAVGEWSDWLMAKTKSEEVGRKEVVTETKEETAEEEIVVREGVEEAKEAELKTPLTLKYILLSIIAPLAVGIALLITGGKGTKPVVIILVVAEMIALVGGTIVVGGRKGPKEQSVPTPQNEASQELEEEAESQEMVEPSTVKVAVPKGHGVNLRTEPSLESEVITILWWPKEYPFLLKENGWVKIEVEIEKDGLVYSEGWVSEEFVEEIEK